MYIQCASSVKIRVQLAGASQTHTTKSLLSTLFPGTLHKLYSGQVWSWRVADVNSVTIEWSQYLHVGYSNINFYRSHQIGNNGAQRLDFVFSARQSYIPQSNHTVLPLKQTMLNHLATQILASRLCSMSIRIQSWRGAGGNSIAAVPSTFHP